MIDKDYKWLDEVLLPEDDCLGVPGEHCGSCLSDFEDSSYSDMNCCNHAKWRDTTKAKLIVAIEEAVLRGRINELEYVDNEATLVHASGGIVADMTIADRLAELHQQLNSRKVEGE